MQCVFGDGEQRERPLLLYSSASSRGLHMDSGGGLIAKKDGARRPGASMEGGGYRGTSLIIRNCLLLGPYSRTIPRLLWRS